MADEPKLPSEEELAEALSKVRVADLLVNALTGSISLAYHRLSTDARDLSQAKLAIEALRALESPLREAGVDQSLLRDLEQARANLQLAYAKAVSEEQSPAESEGESG